MMKLKTEYEQLLGVILEDLRVCLQYTPNRENDLLCFMEQYIKAPKELRPTILQNLRACMDGKEYPNPYAVYQHYGEQEINLLEQLLRGYLQDMQSCSDKELVLTNLIAAINDLQDKCCGQLIDNWRKDHLTQLLALVCVTFNFLRLAEDHLTQLLALAAKEQCLSSAIAVIDSENRW